MRSQGNPETKESKTERPINSEKMRQLFDSVQFTMQNREISVLSDPFAIGVGLRDQVLGLFRKNYMPECMQFLIKLKEKFDANLNANEFQAALEELFHDYIRPGAKTQINLGTQELAELTRRITHKEIKSFDDLTVSDNGNGHIVTAVYKLLNDMLGNLIGFGQPPLSTEVNKFDLTKYDELKKTLPPQLALSDALATLNTAFTTLQKYQSIRKSTNLFSMPQMPGPAKEYNTLHDKLDSLYKEFSKLLEAPQNITSEKLTELNRKICDDIYRACHSPALMNTKQDKNEASQNIHNAVEIIMMACQQMTTHLTQSAPVPPQDIINAIVAQNNSQDEYKRFLAKRSGLNTPAPQAAPGMTPASA